MCGLHALSIVPAGGRAWSDFGTPASGCQTVLVKLPTVACANDKSQENVRDRESEGGERESERVYRHIWGLNAEHTLHV